MKYYDVFVIKCGSLTRTFNGRIQATDLEHAVLEARITLKPRLKPNEFLGIQRKLK